jgi:hypothetical protein
LVLNLEDDGSIIDCVNYAKVRGQSAAGICLNARGSGWRGASEHEVNVLGCKNYGYISSYGRFGIEDNGSGGVVFNAEYSKITSCENFGLVYGSAQNKIYSSVGGIVSTARSGVVIENCINYATVVGLSFTGGILGDGIFYLTIDNQKIINCDNFGDIYLAKGYKESWTIQYMGGVAGVVMELDSCNNYGKLLGFSSFKGRKIEFVGGIAGGSHSTIDCINHEPLIFGGIDIDNISGGQR